MSDIPAGPDYLARVLKGIYDQDGADIGEEPKSALEVASEKFRDARIEARRRVTRGKGRPCKVVHTLTITETFSPGNGDAARVSDPEVHFESKLSKAPPIKGVGAWVDSEGNQIGKVEKNLTLAAVDGGKSVASAKAEKEKRKAM